MGDTVEILQFIAVLVFVIGLILGLSYLIRRYSTPGYGPFRKAADRRMSVQESLNLDPKRRAVILRCDKSEYLVIVGGEHDFVLDRLEYKSDLDDQNPKEPVLQTGFQSSLQTSSPLQKETHS